MPANRLPDDDLTDDDLTIPMIAPPERFVDIPDHLVAGMNKRDRQIIEAMHRMAQQIDWLCTNLVAVNSHARRLEKGYIKMRNWRRFIMSKWSLALYIVMLVAPLIISKLVEKWL